MSTFLHSVATSLLQHFGTNLSHVTVVFPGRRASMFLNQALAELSPSPIWAPRYTTIADLFASASPFVQADPVESVCRLHHAYARHVSSPQSLDRFYSWGEVLLSDFDDIDKHMVDATHLFANIRDIKALDDNSYLTPEQEQALRSFFSDFSIEDNSRLKAAFLELWNAMCDIYADFNSDMRSHGLLYAGALQRDVVEHHLEHLDMTSHYVVCGFNVLNTVEMRLFDALHKAGALFYWDYDAYFVRPMPTGFRHEAGHFIRQNLSRYGDALGGADADHFRHLRSIDVIAASGDAMQTSYAAAWLRRQPAAASSSAVETAVVLCDEHLLPSMLHALPPDVGSVNITMGYPLGATPVASMLNVLLDLQLSGFDAVHRTFRPAQLRACQGHPLLRLIEARVWQRRCESTPAMLAYLLEVVTAVAHVSATHTTHTSSALGQEPYLGEGSAQALFTAHTLLQRLHALADPSAALLADVSVSTLRHLLRSASRTAIVPFHGEPAEGVQLMGLLETRTLSFRRVLLLSSAEGSLPRHTAASSFVPVHLREAFGLTTPRHREAVQAYYFYRLLSRASSVTIVYSDVAAGGQTAEPSRFVRQLQAEAPVCVSTFRLQPPPAAWRAAESVTVAKSEGVMRKLRSLYLEPDEAGQTGVLTPSALSKLLSCPLSFYYAYILGLKAPESATTTDAAHFGSIVHRAAELTYESLTARGATIRGTDIDLLLADGGTRLYAVVDKAIADVLEQPASPLTGKMLLMRGVVHTYLCTLLRSDREHAPFQLLEMEQWHIGTLPVTLTDGSTARVRVGGIVDRLDRVDGTLRVVDYKTSQPPTFAIRDVEQLFAVQHHKALHAIQTLLYATIVSTEQQEAVRPCVLYLPAANTAGYDPTLRVGGAPVADVRTHAPSVQACLADTLQQLFNPSEPFRQVADAKACLYCDFRTLCRR